MTKPGRSAKASRRSLSAGLSALLAVLPLATEAAASSSHQASRDVGRALVPAQALALKQANTLRGFTGLEALTPVQFLEIEAAHPKGLDAAKVHAAERLLAWLSDPGREETIQRALGGGGSAELLRRAKWLAGSALGGYLEGQRRALAEAVERVAPSPPPAALGGLEESLRRALEASGLGGAEGAKQALDGFYDRAAQEAETPAQPVAAPAEPTVPRPALAPAAPRAPASTPFEPKTAKAPSGPRPERGSRLSFSPGARWALGLGLAVAAAVGWFAFNWVERQNFWKNSKSAAEAVRIDEASLARDAEELYAMAQEAEARHGRTREALESARSRGDKRVKNATRDTVTQAEAYAEFDRLVVARAQLNHNAVSEDEAKRIGRSAPAAWTALLEEAEEDAAQRGFEGRVSLLLEALRQEIIHERGEERRLGGYIEAFGERLQLVFPGALGEQHRKAAAELEEFRRQEGDREEILIAPAEARQRERTRARLGRDDAEFRSHQQRLRILGDRRQALSPLLQASEAYSRALQEIADKHEEYEDQMRKARANTSVAVRKSRTRYTTRNGKRVRRTEYYTVYEDHSGPYKRRAWDAQGRAEELIRTLPGMRGVLLAALEPARLDPGLIEEGVASWLPRADLAPEADGIPRLPSLPESLADEAQARAAAGAYAPARAAVNRADGKLHGRAYEEENWLAERVERELREQTERARREPERR